MGLTLLLCLQNVLYSELYHNLLNHSTIDRLFQYQEQYLKDYTSYVCEHPSVFLGKLTPRIAERASIFKCTLLAALQRCFIDLCFHEGEGAFHLPGIVNLFFFFNCKRHITKFTILILSIQFSGFKPITLLCNYHYHPFPAFVHLTKLKLCIY